MSPRLSESRLVHLTGRPIASSVLDMVTLTDAQIAELAEARERYVEAKAILDNARIIRDRAVRRIAAEGGGYREIGHEAGVAYQRVAQIVSGRKPPQMPWNAPLEVECPKCGAAGAPEGAPCVDAQGAFHIERHHARLAIFLDEHPELR